MLPLKDAHFVTAGLAAGVENGFPGFEAGSISDFFAHDVVSNRRVEVSLPHSGQHKAATCAGR